MHDLRRKVLESNKTVSKKTQARLASATSSAVPSRTNSTNVSRHGSDEEDGNASDSTSWSVDAIDEMISTHLTEEGMEANAVTTLEQELGMRIEELINRKRSSTQGRELALAKYCNILTRLYAYDVIHNKTDELIPTLLKSVKSESEQEASMALRAIALTVITVSSRYEEVHQALKRSYAESEIPAINAGAIHALSACAAFGGASEAEMEDIMDELLEIVESDGCSIEAEDSGEVVAAACQAWGFLATYIEDVEDKTEPAMEAFVEQLESGDAEVLVAAGKNIALLFEKSYTPRESEDGPASVKEDEQGFAIDDSYVKRYEVYRQKKQLEHTISQLAKESSKGVGKKERKKLHTTFPDVLNTLSYPSRGPQYSNAIDSETGKRYGSRMTIRLSKDGVVVIDKWSKLLRLETLKRVLGAGIVVHYDQNETIYEALPER